MTARHSWCEPVRFPLKTERECRQCDVVRVTRHEPGERAWQEFWKHGTRIKCDRTPPCDHDKRGRL
ncbi:MAG: hypothetical protein AB7U62_04020 [Pseudolabrys sp.]